LRSYTNVVEMATIPDGVDVKLTGSTLEASGPKGKGSRTFSMRGVKISMDGKEIKVEGPMMMANTVEAHIRNILKGCKEGYSRKLKIIYAHFPIAIEIKGREMMIKNFIGEKQPRRAKICGDVKVESKGTEMTVTGASIEDVGQTIANIRTATKIKKRDSRIFQDGIYPVEG